MADCTGLEAIKSWPQLESWIGVWSLVWLEWVSEWVTRSLSLALLRWQWETHTTNSYSSAQLKPMFVQGSTTYHKDKSEPSQRRYADKTTILVGNENNILYWLYTDLMTVTERPWLCEKLTTPQRLKTTNCHSRVKLKPMFFRDWHLNTKTDQNRHWLLADKNDNTGRKRKRHNYDWILSEDRFG